MGAFTILSYLNKISLLAFFITAGFLFYQVYLLKKESTPKAGKPVIPDFDENIKVDISNYSKLPPTLASAPVPIKKERKTLIIAVSALSVLTLALFFVISFRSKPSAPVDLVVNVTPSVILTKFPTPTSAPKSTLTPTSLPSLKLSPTEVVLAVVSPSPTTKTNLSPTLTVNPTSITSLPTTGVVDTSLLIFGVASFLILFSFVF
ncbi:MAG: hypothetical protein US40_C0002G0128 [Candidatus Roizmanbacteria bacterium GW2011_GWC2_37_13]|uniref:Uncharacterized protein n=1 Tax=Candidatus Roizmanbacteria bacterium GW2011_GWC2_37_13 TaxID=1618486 RepID=A0A0G0IR15_9BACT|nr:MAG: hypothetical protein US38_C0013G0009 [Candidatus Roizmanbacteria bacterium GW2011_GWC1_37_12]KKQ26594.1 MAG: hypothetical protein US40_C0002G0128 [Candidatus Roizmanbacteria bacterium GW2011_GWC2_37_13]